MATADKTGEKLKKTAAREQRLAAALRANLRRRKAQERGRDADAADESGSRISSSSLPPRGGGEGR